MPPATSASNSKVAGAIPSVSSDVISTIRGSVRAAINSKESNTSFTGGGEEGNDVVNDVGDATVLPVDIVVPCSAVVAGALMIAGIIVGAFILWGGNGMMTTTSPGMMDGGMMGGGGGGTMMSDSFMRTAIWGWLQFGQEQVPYLL